MDNLYSVSIDLSILKYLETACLHCLLNLGHLIYKKESHSWPESVLSLEMPAYKIGAWLESGNLDFRKILISPKTDIVLLL